MRTRTYLPFGMRNKATLLLLLFSLSSPNTLVTSEERYDINMFLDTVFFSCALIFYQLFCSSDREESLFVYDNEYGYYYRQ